MATYVRSVCCYPSWSRNFFPQEFPKLILGDPLSSCFRASLSGLPSCGCYCSSSPPSWSDVSRTRRSSVAKQRFFFRKTKLYIGKRAFSVAAPTIWNQLAIAIKSSETMDTFRKQLKTYLFDIAFPPYYNFGGSMLQ